MMRFRVRGALSKNVRETYSSYQRSRLEPTEVDEDSV
jgi:hypothetical protein